MQSRCIFCKILGHLKGRSLFHLKFVSSCILQEWEHGTTAHFAESLQLEKDYKILQCRENQTIREWGRRKFKQFKHAEMTAIGNFKRHPAYKVTIAYLGSPSICGTFAASWTALWKPFCFVTEQLWSCWCKRKEEIAKYCNAVFMTFSSFWNCTVLFSPADVRL